MFKTPYAFLHLSKPYDFHIYTTLTLLEKSLTFKDIQFQIDFGTHTHTHTYVCIYTCKRKKSLKIFKENSAKITFYKNGVLYLDIDDSETCFSKSYTLLRSSFYHRNDLVN